jgi:hypothetical protein
MDLLKIPSVLMFMEADDYPCTFMMGFHPATVKTTKWCGFRYQPLVDTYENIWCEVVHGVLYGFVAGCSFHPEELVELEVFSDAGECSVADTEHELQQEKYGEV